MPGFFESIVRRKTDRQMLAAWVIAGPAAGAKALFFREEDHYSQEYCDEAFPEDCALEISKLSSLSREPDGILEQGDSRVFLEQINIGRKLVICGAGHVALSVIRIGVMLGFEVTVIEDREEFAARAGEAGAHHVICRPFEEALEGIEGDPATAFVIMTREHVHDVACLRRVLKKNYAYAGMMGSRSRTGKIREQLLEEGYDPGKLDQVHMPIGLRIGSRTPEEIAVSVTAELIQVMNEADAGEGFPAGMAEELASISIPFGTEKSPEPDEAQKTFYRELHKDFHKETCKTEGLSGVLAMIVEKTGEAPRRPGTKMLVRKDGSFLGTVGGGYAEAVILKTARDMIREGEQECRQIRIVMQKGTMMCGGEITVFLLPV